MKKKSTLDTSVTPTLHRVHTTTRRLRAQNARDGRARRRNARGKGVLKPKRVGRRRAAFKASRERRADTNRRFFLCDRSIGRLEAKKMPRDFARDATPWSLEEDATLLRLQGRYGNRWSDIAREMRTRNGQQCAQRWRHKVNPNIRRERWTREEDEKVRVCCVCVRARERERTRFFVYRIAYIRWCFRTA